MSRQAHLAIVADVDDNGQITLCNVISDISCAQLFDIVLELHRRLKDTPQFLAEADRFVYTFVEGAEINVVTPRIPKEPHELLREQPMVSKENMDAVLRPPS